MMGSETSQVAVESMMSVKTIAPASGSRSSILAFLTEKKLR